MSPEKARFRPARHKNGPIVVCAGHKKFPMTPLKNRMKPLLALLPGVTCSNSRSKGTPPEHFVRHRHPHRLPRFPHCTPSVPARQCRDALWILRGSPPGVPVVFGHLAGSVRSLPLPASFSEAGCAGCLRGPGRWPFGYLRGSDGFRMKPGSVIWRAFEPTSCWGK